MHITLLTKERVLKSNISALSEGISISTLLQKKNILSPDYCFSEVGLFQTLSTEELNEFLNSNLESNPTTIKSVKETLTNSLNNKDIIEIS